jgi:hypothetical protein
VWQPPQTNWAISVPIHIFLNRQVTMFRYFSGCHKQFICESVVSASQQFIEW